MEHGRLYYLSDDAVELYGRTKATMEDIRNLKLRYFVLFWFGSAGQLVRLDNLVDYFSSSRRSRTNS